MVGTKTIRRPSRRVASLQCCISEICSMICMDRTAKLECWSTGVLEYWGIAPPLHYSITPFPHSLPKRMLLAGEFSLANISNKTFDRPGHHLFDIGIPLDKLWHKLIEQP